MTPSLGVNLRVTGHCNQGGRKYMEDVFSVAYQQTQDEKDLEYAFFGIFDGHGGQEAAHFAKNHLMDAITKQKHFWSDNDELVLKAIREGFLVTQQAMWKSQVTWRKTASGMPSTAGTTASVCFIKRGKLFIGHVGDSGIVLGERDPHQPTRWRARPLTREHKPDCEMELARIHEAGGKVISKSGVPRVVWYRPSGDHQGPVRRSTPISEVPFLAVARALGDFWSYNPKDDVFVVSPDPDLHVMDLNVMKDRCLILATDGAWNVLSADMAVQCVFDTERNNEQHMINPDEGYTWINPSKKLVDLALERWNMCSLRPDNTSVVTVMLDPPGPPRAKVLRRLHGVDPVTPVKNDPHPLPQVSINSPQAKLNKGIAIISRFPNSDDMNQKQGTNLVSPRKVSTLFSTRIIHDSSFTEPQKFKIETQLPNQPKEGEEAPELTPPLPARSHPAPAPENRTRKRKTLPSTTTASSPPPPPPPPLPAKPVFARRARTHSGYNSDSENQAINANSLDRRTLRSSAQASRSTGPNTDPPESAAALLTTPEIVSTTKKTPSRGRACSTAPSTTRLLRSNSKLLHQSIETAGVKRKIQHEPSSDLQQTSCSDNALKILRIGQKANTSRPVSTVRTKC